MLGTPGSVDFLQNVAPGSTLLEWQSYDPPRQFLIFTPSERQGLTPSAWTASVAPRWKTRLSELVLSSREKERNEKTVFDAACALPADDDALDNLVMGFIEYFNGVLFHRVTSHQATETLRHVLELCADKIEASAAAATPEPPEVSSCASQEPNEETVKDAVDKNQSSLRKESGARRLGKPALPGGPAQAGVSGAASQSTTVVAATTAGTRGPSAVHIVLEATPTRVAVLDALRWSVEYAMNLAERLAQHAASRSGGAAGAAASAGALPHTGNGSSVPTSHSTVSLKNAGASSAKTSSVDVLRSQQRVLSLLEVVEKAGLLSPVEIIGNLPYSQLDLIAYYTTRDRLSLMKLNVRMRTKDIFTLPVYNLEGENPVGYARLHVCLQAFVSSVGSAMSCGCWKTASAGIGASASHTTAGDGIVCPIVSELAANLRRLIVEFQLCINRVVHIILLYMEHFLFVLRHSLLDALLVVASRSRIVECLVFQIVTYENALTGGALRSRSGDSISMATSSPSMYPPSHRFYHLCAFLHIEGLIGLDELWSHIGPPESFLHELVAVSTRLTTTQPSAEKRDTEADTGKQEVASGAAAPTPPEAPESLGTDNYLCIVPSSLTSEQALSLLTTHPFGKLTLVSALIDLNAWSSAMVLLKRLVRSCPLWSLHLSQSIVQSIGHLLCWMVQPFVRNNLASAKVGPTTPATVSAPEAAFGTPGASDQSTSRSSAVGGYPSAYVYGLRARPLGTVGMTPVDSEAAFRAQCVPVLELLGPALGSLPAYVLELVVDALTNAIRSLRVARPSGTGAALDQPNVFETLPSCYPRILATVVLPSMALAEPRVILAEKLWNSLVSFTVLERFALYADFFYHVRPQCPKLVATSQLVRRTVGRELKRVTAEQSDTRGPAVLFTTHGGGHSVMGEIVVKQKSKTTHSEQTVMDSLLKLCCANPFEVMDVILHQVEIFDSMLIRVIINYLPSLPALCCDITVFLVTERQHCLEMPDRSIGPASGTKPKRLRNMAHFIARFLRRFPSVEARPLLISVASRIIQETTEPTYPDRLTGKYCDITYLEELITWMGGVPSLATEELSRDQVDCLGGGPHLRVMMLVDENRREELYRPGSLAARSRLREALVQKEVFRSLLFGLSKFRLEVQYDSQLLCEAQSLQLRSVAALTDEVHLSLLQVIYFVLLPESNAQLLQPLDLVSSPPDVAVLLQPPARFAAVLPSFFDILRFCEPAVVWLLVRATLHPIYQTVQPESDLNSGKAAVERDLTTEGFYPLTELHLTHLVDRCFPEPHPGLRELYLTFWRLDLHDIWIPEEVYTKQISFITDALKQIAAQRRPQGASSTSSQSYASSSPATTHHHGQKWSSTDDPTVQRELDVMVQRLNDWKKTFEVELCVLSRHKERVLSFLKCKKHRWFQPDTAGPSAMTHFLQHMIAPRLLNSQKDALYCIQFVQMLVSLDTEGFYLIDFFNKWTGILTPLVRSCSIQEADYLGLFVNDMTAILNQWIRQPALLHQYVSENRSCYARLITRKNSIPRPGITADAASHDADQDGLSSSTDAVGGADVEMSGPKKTTTGDAGTSAGNHGVIDTSDLLKAIGKWENRIFRVIQHGLSLTEKEASWMSQRIVIKFLNTTHKNFPITDVAGTQILRSLPPLIERAKEARWDDVVANARALDRNLRVVEPHWLKRKEEDDEDTRKGTAGPVVTTTATAPPSTASSPGRAAGDQEGAGKKGATAGVVEDKKSESSTGNGPSSGSGAGPTAGPPTLSGPAATVRLSTGGGASSPNQNPSTVPASTAGKNGTTTATIEPTKTSTPPSASSLVPASIERPAGSLPGPKNPFHAPLSEAARVTTVTAAHIPSAGVRNTSATSGSTPAAVPPSSLPFQSGGPARCMDVETQDPGLPSDATVTKRPSSSSGIVASSQAASVKRQKTAVDAISVQDHPDAASADAHAAPAANPDGGPVKPATEHSGRDAKEASLGLQALTETMESSLRSHPAHGSQPKTVEGTVPPATGCRTTAAPRPPSAAAVPPVAQPPPLSSSAFSSPSSPPSATHKPAEHIPSTIASPESPPNGVREGSGPHRYSVVPERHPTQSPVVGKSYSPASQNVEGGDGDSEVKTTVAASRPELLPSLATPTALTPHELKERKFEKQKEIDELRQRIKSLHTHRSKSASSGPSERPAVADQENSRSSLSPSTTEPSRETAPREHDETRSNHAHRDALRETSQSRSRVGTINPAASAGTSVSGHSDRRRDQHGGSTQTGSRSKQPSGGGSGDAYVVSSSRRDTQSSSGTHHSHSLHEDEKNDRLYGSEQQHGSSSQTTSRLQSRDAQGTRSYTHQSSQRERTTVSRRSPWSSSTRGSLVPRHTSRGDADDRWTSEESRPVTTSGFSGGYASNPSLVVRSLHSNYSTAATSRFGRVAREDGGTLDASGSNAARNHGGVLPLLPPPPPPPPPPPLLLPPPPPRSAEGLASATAASSGSSQVRASSSSRLRGRDISDSTRTPLPPSLDSQRQTMSPRGPTASTRVHSPEASSRHYDAQITGPSTARYVSRNSSLVNGGSLVDRSSRLRNETYPPPPVRSSSSSSWSGATGTQREMTVWYRNLPTPSSSDQWGGGRASSTRRSDTLSEPRANAAPAYQQATFDSAVDHHHPRRHHHHHHRSGTSSSSSPSNSYRDPVPQQEQSKRQQDHQLHHHRNTGGIRSRSRSRIDSTRRRRRIHDGSTSTASTPASSYRDQYTPLEPSSSSLGDGLGPSGTAFSPYKHHQNCSTLNDGRLLRSIHLSSDMVSQRSDVHGPNFSAKRH